MNYMHQENNNILEESKPNQIYKFLIQLYNDHDDGPIWRVLEIPEHYSFFDLHVAIQDSMTWLDVELHKFNMRNPVTLQMDYIGIQDDLMCEAIVMEKEALIAKYFTLSNCECTYMYNFVKPWTFRINLEKILPAIPNIKYPRCVAGDGMAPEDGIEESENFSWADLSFDLNRIKFRDPEVAWLDAFQGF